MNDTLKDLIWLDEENKRRQLKKMKKIKDEMFEQTIDRLEKETYFKVPYFEIINSYCCSMMVLPKNVTYSIRSKSIKKIILI